MAKQDGGPAFPHETFETAAGNALPCAGAGMTLRDYFAARALAALVSAEDMSAREDNSLAYAVLDGADFDYNETQIADDFAAAAYVLADAMLKARA